jgi:ABC-type molybdate transport system ATPase subunit
MISVDAAVTLGDFDLVITFENDDGITALFGRSG